MGDYVRASVHGAPPDTRLLQAIRQEESRSGRKIEVVDQSLLEAIASGQVAEMQRLLLEGKEVRLSLGGMGLSFA